jgi:hypothetical protein
MQDVGGLVADPYGDAMIEKASVIGFDKHQATAAVVRMNAGSQDDPARLGPARDPDVDAKKQPGPDDLIVSEQDCRERCSFLAIPERLETPGPRDALQLAGLRRKVEPDEVGVSFSDFGADLFNSVFRHNKS